MSGNVSIKEIAKETGFDRSTILRSTKKNPNIEIVYVRMPGIANPVAHVSSEDAVSIREYYTMDKEVVAERGVFYIIQLAPDLKEGRVKLGYAQNAEKRLNQHKTAAPTSELIKTYPCESSWEIAAINCIMVNCDNNRLGAESFDFECVDDVVLVADSFFSLMNRGEI